MTINCLMEPVIVDYWDWRIWAKSSETQDSNRSRLRVPISN
jgi:hypothetical protein